MLEQKKISRTFQKWLSLVVVAAFLVTTVISWILQTKISERETKQVLRLNISDVGQDIVDASNKNLLELTYKIADALNEVSEADNEALVKLSEIYDVAEINLVQENGIITASTYPDFVGYDMRNGEQSKAFMALLEGAQTELVQKYQAISYGEGLSRKYAGVLLENGGFVQVGYDAEQFQKDIATQVEGVTKNRHIGETGSLIIMDKNGRIVSDRYGNEGKDFLVTGMDMAKIMEQGIEERTCFVQKIYGEPSYCMYVVSEGYCILASMPRNEAFFNMNVSIYVTAAMQAVIFIALFILIYVLTKHQIVDNIHRVNNSLSKITNGDLDEVVDVRTNQEFASLSNDINSTVLTLKRYIAEAAARIDKELEFAREIQHSSLPCIFPPFPHRTEFDIFASMHTAKEVGGDFYDFYFVDNDRLAFVVADVSDKGIPAAMFMMRAKTLIKGYAESGRSVDETFALTNDELCEHNDANMFVTAWMGVLDLKTGELEFANAGHNPPLLKRKDGSFEFLESHPDFVLASLDDITYEKQSLHIYPGDKLYLYTDGVTEATDEQRHFYGNDRLKEILKVYGEKNPKEICEAVKEDVDHFVGNAVQFDDITMLCLEYKGDGTTAKIVPPTIDSISELSEYMETVLEEQSVSPSEIMKMNVVLDEIFSNIIHYSLATYTKFICNVENQVISLQFEDNGIMFNPLEKENTDLEKPIDEMSIGGLGIVIVKKSVDQMDYEYVDKKNRLTLKKRIERNTDTC